MLTKKYQPKNIKEIVGQDQSINKLIHLIETKKPILLHGPVGTGKTSSIYAFAKSFDYDIIEINASDYRDKNSINQIIGESLKQKSLFNKEKIILVDEIDGINAQKDRGALTSLINLIGGSKYPIIIIGNDIWDSKFLELRKKCNLVEFKKIKDLIILELLKDICVKEEIKIEEPKLLDVVKNSNGDARAAINDLHCLISKKELLDLEMSNRDKKSTIFDILKNIFKGDLNVSIESLSNTDTPLDEILLWLEENIPYEYQKRDLEGAYDNLSRADVFRGRIRRWQYWRFLVYQNLLMSAVTLSKNKNKNFVNYKRSSRILKIWLANRKNSKKLFILTKLAKENHLSTKKLLKEFPYIKNIFKSKDYLKDSNFTKEEIKYLIN